MSVNLHTGYDALISMGVFDLIDMCDDYNDLQKEAQRKAGKR